MSKRQDLFYRDRGRTEIDLRSEFNNTMYGDLPEIAKSQKGLLRRFRVDNSGEKIKCHCVSPVTGEPDKERRCTTCLGEGFQWDEEPIDFYHAHVGSEGNRAYRENLHPTGSLNTSLRIFYIPVVYTLTKKDKLVLLELDKEGNPTLPLKRIKLYRVTLLQEMRLDNGRLEFWKVNTYAELNKHL